jgi:hypothetical protein
MEKLAGELSQKVAGDASMGRFQKWALQKAIARLPSMVKIFCSDQMTQNINTTLHDGGSSSKDWEMIIPLVEDIRASLCNIGEISTWADVMWHAGDVMDRHQHKIIGGGSAVNAVLYPEKIANRIQKLSLLIQDTLCSPRFRKAFYNNMMVRSDPSIDVTRMDVMIWNWVVRTAYVTQPFACRTAFAKNLRSRTAAAAAAETK